MASKRLVQIRIDKGDHDRSKQAAKIARLPLATLTRIALHEKTSQILNSTHSGRRYR